MEPLGTDNAVYRIVSKSSGKVLDVPGLADGAPIVQYTDHGRTNQQWRLVPVSPKVYKIVSIASDKVLDVPGAVGADGVQIQQYTDDGGTNQWWQLASINHKCNA